MGRMEIIRTKTYYEGMETALEFQRLFQKDLDSYFEEDGLELPKEYCDALALYKIFGPFLNVLTYIHNNRFVWESRNSLLKGHNHQLHSLTNEELFNVLKTLSKYTIIDFLSLLKASASDSKKLLNSVMNDQFDAFDTIVNTKEYNTSSLSVLCQDCWSDSSLAFDIQSLDDVICYLDHVEQVLKNYIGDDDDTGVVLQQVRQMQPALIELNKGHEEEKNIETFSKGYIVFLHNTVYSALSYFWENIESYSTRENEIIKGMLAVPDALEWVNLYRQHYEEVGDMDVTPEEVQKIHEKQERSFVMTESFFSRDKKALNTQENEHFLVQGPTYVQPIAAPIYQELIDWLTEQKYIANSDMVKNTFAYRLTGYGRPEHLEPIEWFASDSYELVFLVKSLPIKTDYKKMKEFFTGPKWLKEKDSSYAYLADKEFKNQVTQACLALKRLPKKYPK